MQALIVRTWRQIMKLDNNTSSIYWLGGSTCAGKTTISNLLSEKYRFTVYHCDEYLGKHIQESNALEHPNLNQITNLNWNDILSLNVNEYLSWTMDLFKEEFPMILEDLNKLSDGRPILVEGVSLLPELINKEFHNSDHAIWVVADEAFYKEHQMERKEFYERIKECSDQEQALKNYIDNDLAFGKYIINSANKFGLRALEVRNNSDISIKLKAISEHFKLVN
jgi:2-phosphoglycerate kinase